MKHCLLLFSLSLLLSSCLSFYPCWPGSLYILNETGMPIHIETNIVSRTDIAGNSGTGQQEIRSFDLDTDSCALLAKSGEVSDNESFTIESAIVTIMLIILRFFWYENGEDRAEEMLSPTKHAYADLVEENISDQENLQIFLDDLNEKNRKA